MAWPKNFKCIPDENWVNEPLQKLAKKYDTVEEHGWYDNLNITVSQLSKAFGPNDIIIDYSGGTGILTSRLMRTMKKNCPHIIIVDSSPKFLRLALEKFCTEERIAFRLIPFDREEKRLSTLEECIDESILKRGVDGIVSTNAIHLYYELNNTINSWKKILRPDGYLHVQSGNIRNPKNRNSWIIDETVEHLNNAAIRLVNSQHSFLSLRNFLDDDDHMEAHDKLRQKYFLPVRELEYYTKSLEENGFTIKDIQCHPINASVDEWYDFLSVYHEGVLGWVGGAEKVYNQKVSSHFISLRKALMRLAMEDIFNGSDSFQAAWTYINAS